MPIGYAKSILGGGSIPKLETIVVLAAYSGSSVSAGIMMTSFSTTKDELSIVGSATGTTNGRYCPIADGTYKVEITATGGTPGHSGTIYARAWGCQIGVGQTPNHNALPGNWSFTDSATFTGSADADVTPITNNFTPTSLGNITFDSSTKEGLTWKTTTFTPSGGFTGSSPSWTIKLTET